MVPLEIHRRSSFEVATESVLLFRESLRIYYQLEHSGNLQIDSKWNKAPSRILSVKKIEIFEGSLYFHYVGFVVHIFLF